MSARTKANISDYSAGLTTVSTTILSAYFGRNFLLIKNNGPGACAVNLRGGTAIANAVGNIQLASGQSITFQKNVPQNAITAISASTSQLTVQSDDSLTYPSFLFQTTPFPYWDFDFVNGKYWINATLLTTPTTFLTTSRTTTNGTATNLLPISASGSTITTFADNVPRITPGSGILLEEQRINQLLNSTNPQTQTTGALGVATFTAWVNGSGSATISAGTATISSGGVATQGSPFTFNVTVGGTVVVTVAGSLNAFQLEQGIFGTSLIVTSGSTATRAIDSVKLTNSTSLGSQSTIFVQGSTQAPINTGTNQEPIMMTDGTNNNRFGVFRNNANLHITGLSTVGGANGLPDAGVLNTNTRGKIAFTVASTDQAICLNGGTIGTSAAIWPPVSALTQTELGALLAGSSWNGYVERAALWPFSRLNNSTLQAITT